MHAAERTALRAHGTVGARARATMAGRRGFVISLALLCVAAGGCGGSSNSSSGGGSGSGGSGSKSPIVVGTIAPAGTSTINFPGIFSAAQAAAATINSQGGIHGHPIKVLTCNSQGTANGEIGCARKLLGEHVVAFVGANIDNATTPFNQLLTQANVVDIANTGADLLAYSGSVSYTPTFIDGTFDPCVSGLLASSSHRAKSAVLVATGGVPLSLFTPFFVNQTKADGVTWLKPIITPTTVSDYGPYVARAEAEHAGMVVMQLLGSGPQAFVSASSQAGATYDICTAYGLAGSGKWKGLGAAANNVYVGADFTPVSNSPSAPPLMKTMYASFEARYRAGDANANPAPTTIQAQGVETWVGMWALAQVARSISGPVTTTALFNAMPHAKATFGGVIPDIDFSKPQSCGLFKRVFASTEYLWKYRPASDDYALVGSLPNNFKTAVCGT